MTLRTSSLPLRHDGERLANCKDTAKPATGSLSVHLVKGREAAHIPDLEKDCRCRKDGHIFIIFNRTDHGTIPVAYCCITDDIEVRQGITFESSNRFASEMLIKRYPDKHFLEISTFHMLNRKKVHRAKGLLWRAITDYCECNHIDYILGCFSFDGKYPAAYAMELSYLYHYCQADPELQVTASEGVTMDIMPAEAVNPDKVFRFLPPLLRYCLRLGARVSDMVVVDKSMDAMNVFLLLPARTIHASAF